MDSMELPEEIEPQMRNAVSALIAKIMRDNQGGIKESDLVRRVLSESKKIVPFHIRCHLWFRGDYVKEIAQQLAQKDKIYAITDEFGRTTYHLGFM